MEPLELFELTMVDDWEPVLTGRGELVEMGDTGE